MLPQALSPIENASAPLRVLVTAASGGVGHIAVQLAKVDAFARRGVKCMHARHLSTLISYICIHTRTTIQAAGHYVVGTAGPTNQELIKSLGADETLDYSTQDVETVYKDAPFDIVVDCVGGA